MIDELLRVSPQATVLAVSVEGRGDEGYPVVQRFLSGAGPHVREWGPLGVTGDPVVVLRQDLLALRRAEGSERPHVVLALPANLDVLSLLVELWRARVASGPLTDLTIGQGACGDHGGRLRWVRTDLRTPDWVTALDEDGKPGTFDAVLSSTALHWLGPPELVAVYRAAATLLKPGGVLINADYLPAGPRNKRIKAASVAVNARRQSAALARGAEDWETWWKSAESVPALSEAVDARRGIWAEGAKNEWASPGIGYHEAALREAGFAEVDVVWQDLEERVLIALMP
ncbi:class I SAM-dependent methyltransferase [Streptomyces thermodiastaticus]|uniref:class I SAM-dependent methyltransferase n=1 Tax=Streptomyces thermoviolaceus TaxID=1952 RepID=UPI00167B8074|nr:class I SAM-dependent methyltransferase [Streptomyces thermoviolaceus]WTD46770.1 class I SAM-dependent methyltransferase [Streptomyces thermoviolaceus]